MTYEEAALEEIRNDHPTAYEILKGALPEKFVPYFKSIHPTGTIGNTAVSKRKNQGGILCLQGFDLGDFTSDNCVDQGVLKIGLNSYKLTNVVATGVQKHQLNFEIEKLEVI